MIPGATQTKVDDWMNDYPRTRRSRSRLAARRVRSSMSRSTAAAAPSGEPGRDRGCERWRCQLPRLSTTGSSRRSRHDGAGGRRDLAHRDGRRLRPRLVADRGGRVRDRRRRAVPAAGGLAYVPAVLAEQGHRRAAVADRTRHGSWAAPVRAAARDLLGAAPIQGEAVGDGGFLPNTGALANGRRRGCTVSPSTRSGTRTGRRSAAQMGVTPAKVGWVRMLNPPSCKFCVLLAGKFYRWNQGFQAAPGCDCRHIPSNGVRAGDLTVDPYAYFHSLDPRRSRTGLFGKADAQAIRDGADIYRVVNIRSRNLASDALKNAPGLMVAGRRDATARRQLMTIEDVLRRGEVARERARATAGERVSPAMTSPAATAGG
jgi:hypothetical protein